MRQGSAKNLFAFNRSFEEGLCSILKLFGSWPAIERAFIYCIYPSSSSSSSLPTSSFSSLSPRAGQLPTPPLALRGRTDGEVEGGGGSLRNVIKFDRKLGDFSSTGQIRKNRIGPLNRQPEEKVNDIP